MKSLRYAYLFWLLSLVGVCGLHRLYLGKPLSGLLFLFTGGLFGIGTIYDALTMPGLVEQARLREGIVGKVELSELFDEGRGAGDQSWQSRTSPGTRGNPEDRLQLAVLKVAKRGGGYAAAGEVALEAGTSLEQAREAMDVLAAKGLCELRVRSTGALVYYFIDFADERTAGNDPDSFA
ncbi:TM2 domain-containing protein [Spirochaeta africana]|uniref:TM2 domain-containing protein n=1 Tax=Spirochaeta africana (strain ATCC 700263 / DSM 8902 / Z-7692) TaxID=889378 RepID=H9UGQ9_SPIAZ|nr:TM2 domain-containing protein [Spirochaeta africana]AFG36702.1 TM2 domain-containing protein [Spirochaeta africana DSM 8902]